MLGAEQIVIIVVLAVLGKWLLTKLSFPAAAMIGPIILIGGYQIWGGNLPQFPLRLVDLFQIILGLSTGAKINKEKLIIIKKMWLPACLVIFWTIILTVLMTWVIDYYSIDLLTAFFSAAPGGINVMAALALEYRSEAVIVSTYQFVRLLVILGLVPLVAKYIKHKAGTDIKAPEYGLKTAEKVDLTCDSTDLYKQYGAGILGGVLLALLNFPSGALIGALFGMAAMNVRLGKETVFPQPVMQAALIGIGASVGLEFFPLMGQKVQEMFGQIMVFTLIIVFGNFILAYAIHRITNWDIITCLLSSTPGGLNQMLVVGEELQADTVVISILQLVRMLLIVICVPLLTFFITG